MSNTLKVRLKDGTTDTIWANRFNPELHEVIGNEDPTIPAGPISEPAEMPSEPDMPEAPEVSPDPVSEEPVNTNPTPNDEEIPASTPASEEPAPAPEAKISKKKPGRKKKFLK